MSVGATPSTLVFNVDGFSWVTDEPVPELLGEYVLFLAFGAWETNRVEFSPLRVRRVRLTLHAKTATC